MSSLTLEQRIAQLFMVAAYSNKGVSHQQEIENLISKYHIGGLMFMQGGPITTITFNKYLSIFKQSTLDDSSRCRMGIVYAY